MNKDWKESESLYKTDKRHEQRIQSQIPYIIISNDNRKPLQQTIYHYIRVYLTCNALSHSKRGIIPIHDNNNHISIV